MAQQGKSLIWIRHTAELPALPQHSQAFSAKLHIQVVYNAKERSTRWRGCDPGSHALLGASTHWLCLWVCWVTSSLRTAVFFPKLQGVPHTHRGLRGCVCPLLKCTIIPCGALTLRVNTSKSPFLLQTTITCNFGPSVHVLMCSCAHAPAVLCCSWVWKKCLLLPAFISTKCARSGSK